MDEKTFYCTMCGKSFSESGYLKRNMRGPTQGDKPFQCSNHFSSVWQEFFNISLQNSPEDSQGREMIYAPNVTRVSLSQNTKRIIIGALQVHSVLWTIPPKVSWIDKRELTNLSEKPFKCTMCGKSFSESGYLKRNMRGPTKERKKFQCTKCDKSFSVF